jgi:hypothetical protein
MYYLPPIHIVHKGLAEWLTSGDYSIRGHERVYLVKLPTSRLDRTNLAVEAGIARLVTLRNDSRFSPRINRCQALLFEGSRL